MMLLLLLLLLLLATTMKLGFVSGTCSIPAPSLQLRCHLSTGIFEGPIPGAAICNWHCPSMKDGPQAMILAEKMMMDHWKPILETTYWMQLNLLICLISYLPVWDCPKLFANGVPQVRAKWSSWDEVGAKSVNPMLRKCRSNGATWARLAAAVLPSNWTQRRPNMGSIAKYEPTTRPKSWKYRNNPKYHWNTHEKTSFQPFGLGPRWVRVGPKLGRSFYKRAQLWSKFSVEMPVYLAYNILLHFWPTSAAGIDLKPRLQALSLRFLLTLKSPVVMLLNLNS